MVSMLIQYYYVTASYLLAFDEIRKNKNTILLYLVVYTFRIDIRPLFVKFSAVVTRNYTSHISHMYTITYPNDTIYKRTW